MFALSNAGSWNDKIGGIDLIKLHTNTIQILSLDFKWVNQILNILQMYIQSKGLVLALTDLI